MKEYSNPPPAAVGMELLFADDFDGPLSISRNDSKAKYYSHSRQMGQWISASIHFPILNLQEIRLLKWGTHFRIRASDKLHSSGIISSLKSDGKERRNTAKLPCYFECKFIGPNAYKHLAQALA